jgi:hypothetical protein
MLQSRHSASQRRQSASAFPLDQRFEGFAQQRRFLSYPGKFLSDAYKIIV